MENLKDLLVKYRMLTEEISACLKNDGYDKLDELLGKRQEIIKHVDTLEYSMKEFREISDQNQLQALEENLNGLFNNKRLELKNNLDIIAKGRNVNNIYNKKLSVDSFFFSKKL